MVFSELLEKFRQQFENSASRASRVTSVPREMVKNGGPGRPLVHIPPEVLEELRGLGFTLTLTLTLTCFLRSARSGFQGGRLLSCWDSGWALIRRWAVNRVNTV